MSRGVRGLASSEKLEQLGPGERDGEISGIDFGGRIVNEGAVREFHPVSLSEVGDVPQHADLLVPGARGVDSDGDAVEERF